MTPPEDPTDLLFQAVSFAARAHRHQVRKDGTTPYAAHPFRVCLVVRHVFGIDDPKVLTAAVLHDTIEDTTTDFDDIAGKFGTEVATWVAALSKDMRLPDEEKEDAYHRVLATAPWQVLICKLADLYDNLSDSPTLTPRSREKAVTRAGHVLDAIRPNLPPECLAAFAAIEQKILDMQRS
jgi:guanosine-3',5'-bis(diphosphate) 3'-pyrophosphohydrolase